MTDRDFRPTDPIVGRAVDSLRNFPAVDRDTIARTVAAAARLRAADAEPNDDDLVPATPARRWSARSLARAVAAVVFVAGGLGLAVSRWARPAPESRVATRPASPRPIPAPALPASASSEAVDAAAIPTQFVYDGRARHVALVGDFNGWDERATPLVREPGTALWSATVPLQRGRHVYAFLVDSTWTPDRRAPVSRDPDFGVEGSVIIVGRP